MNLNRRLLLGISPILVIFLGVGIYAIFLFSKLGGAIDVILRENYRSVIASENMKEAAQQMDSGLRLALDGDEAKGKDLFQQNAPIFQSNLDVELHTITLPGEGELAAKVTHLHDDYAAAAAKFYALAPTDPARHTLYAQQLSPTFTGIEETAGRILEINQQNMVEANDEARRQSRAASRYMIVALLAGFVIATSVTYALARSLIQPIQSLTESARQLGEGNLNQHVPVESQDEVGILARAFNKMAARLRDYRQSTTDQILRAQQVTDSALRAFPDPIFVFSPEKEIQLQNAAADAFVQHLGGNVLLLDPLATYVDESLKGAADFQPTSFDKAIMVNAGAGEKYFMPRILTMRAPTGAALGVVLALQEVTRFRVADDMKTNLIATVSHELKTPLTSMQMAVYLLLEEKVGPLNPKQTELLLAARNNSDRLFEMIEDLLDLARFEGGAALIEKKAGLRRSIARRDRRADEKELVIVSRGRELKIVKEPHLPRVEISRVRIDQVFANFISNAVKYSPPGSTITLSAKRESAKTVRFAVRDEGAGVPKDLRRRIFDKFFRAPESGDEGAGLGLSIAREIVLAHGGNIGVESEQRQGQRIFLHAARSRLNSINFMKERTLIKSIVALLALGSSFSRREIPTSFTLSAPSSSSPSASPTPHGASASKFMGTLHRRTDLTRTPGLSLHRHDLAGEILILFKIYECCFRLDSTRPLFWALLLLITKPLGLYLLRVLDARGRTWLDPLLGPVERLTYRLAGIDPAKEQHWKQYTISMLIFSLVTMLFTYALLRLQANLHSFQHLLNPQAFPAVSDHLAFDTAASFTSNTNWQSYGGESTMSYLSQMVALTSQNFFSAAVGIAIAAALVRGIARHLSATVGNFWVDLVRITYYLLLPICVGLRDLPDLAGHRPKLQAVTIPRR